MSVMAHSKTRTNDGKITYPPGVKEISDKISKEEMVRRLKVSEVRVWFLDIPLGCGAHKGLHLVKAPGESKPRQAVAEKGSSEGRQQRTVGFPWLLLVGENCQRGKAQGSWGPCTGNKSTMLTVIFACRKLSPTSVIYLLKTTILRKNVLSFCSYSGCTLLFYKLFERRLKSFSVSFFLCF